MAETLQERMERLRQAKRHEGNMSPKITQQDKTAAPIVKEITQEEERWKPSLEEILEAIKNNPTGIIGKAAANTLARNATKSVMNDNPWYQTAANAVQDAGEWFFSPFKMAGTATKIANASKHFPNSPIVKNLAEPINKSGNITKNAAKNIGKQSLTGAADNILYEGLYQMPDDEISWDGFAISGGMGGLAGGGYGAYLTKQQRDALNNYGKYVAPASYKQEQIQNIRKTQNDVDDNIELLSKLVNESNPVETTLDMKNKAKSATRDAGENLHDIKQNVRNNPDLFDENGLTITELQEMFTGRMDADHSGNLSHSEKNIAIQNFGDDVADALVALSPRAKNNLNEASMDNFGNPEVWKTDQNFMDQILADYKLDPAEINDLRAFFANKTQLTIPNKPGYVRAGTDNRNNNEYANMFRDIIDGNVGDFNNFFDDAARQISEANKMFSTKKGHEELLNTVHMQQGKGGITNSHRPYFDLNPEANPIVKGRQGTVQVGKGIDNIQKGYNEITADSGVTDETISMLAQEAYKLGMSKPSDIKRFIITKLTGEGHPTIDPKVPVMTSGFKRAKHDGLFDAFPDEK